MKNIMYKAFWFIACFLCVLSCSDLDEEVAALNKIEGSEQDGLVDNSPFFKLNTSTAYLSTGYTYIYCDYNDGADVSVTFPDTPTCVKVDYIPSTHIIKIEKIGSTSYYNKYAGKYYHSNLTVRAVVNNKVFTSTVELNDIDSDSGYGTTEEYEVSAATETFTMNISKSSSYDYKGYYYHAVLVDGESWVTGITPTGAVNYMNGSNNITLTFPSNTTGKARTAEVKVYPIKYCYSYSSSYSYDYKYFYTIILTQEAQ